MTRRKTMDIKMHQRLPTFVETGSCFDTTDIDRVKVRIYIYKY